MGGGRNFELRSPESNPAPTAEENNVLNSLKFNKGEAGFEGLGGGGVVCTKNGPWFSGSSPLRLGAS